MFRLDGKIAIVTGGYGLYGTHISRGLAESGATVIIASRNEAKCKEYAQALVAEGLSAAGAYLDLSDEASVNDFVDGVAKEYGRIDILVNNAVLREGMADLEDCTVEGWEKAQKVNSTGLMLITKRVIMYMKQQRDGSIINISSIQGVRGPRFVVYEGTNMSSSLNYTYDKWGMIGFTKWIANKYGKYNIRCNAISPGGYIPQEKPENAPFYENYKKLTPLGRFADDDDIKGPVVFLASKASKYITGDNIMLDGGWTSW
ncbi:MAG: SDR family oxidoreductase [Clostridiaceae bacterium]|nr:SDR family oxidoreductase [Clostridiaceae bacterium]